MLELYLDSPYSLQLRKTTLPPSPQSGEVVVQSIYGGICGSDLRVYKGTIPYAAYPLRPGHEVLGRIVEAGPQVSLKPGTKVVVLPNTFCETCEFCLEGKTNICQKKKSLGVSMEGVFAEKFLIEEKYLIPIPEELANERAVLTEPLAVTVHALNKAGIRPDTSLAIVGCGTEGLLAVALAVRSKAKVTVVDINPEKFAIAKKMGNIATMYPQDLTDERFDVVIEAAGDKKAFEQAMNLVKPGGSLIALGLSGEPVPLFPMQLVRNEITIYGSIIYTRKDFKEAVDFLMDQNFLVEPVLSKCISIHDFQSAYEAALSGNYAKIILEFDK